MKQSILFLAVTVLLSMSACTPKYLKQLEAQKISNPSTQAEKDHNIIVDYLLQNKIKTEKTDSGIFYTMTNSTKGEQPSANSNVQAHYEGRLLDGTKFDSSYDRGTPLEFTLNRVIKGWQEAILLLKKGEKGTFYIPSHLAYGSRGAGNVIPPNAVLVFDIELVDFK